MIIWSTAALRDGRATLSRGYSYGKNERLELRNEDVWERNRGKGSKTLTGESSHSNEIGSIWNMYFFFCTQMHIYWPHLITEHRSETERAWEGDSRATWRENEATSFILALQSSAIKIIITWKFDLPFWPIVRFYLHHFALIEQKDMLCFKCNFTSSFFLFFFPWQIWEQKFRSHNELCISYVVRYILVK